MIVFQFMSLFWWLMRFILGKGPGLIALAHYGAK